MVIKAPRTACLLVAVVIVWSALADDAHTSVRLGEDIPPNEALPPLFPLTFQECVGFLCAVLGLVVASWGGVGGGGMLVPIYTMLLDFPIKQAISLTSMTVLGGAIANNLLNARKKHPDHPNRPLIDWDLLLLLEPTTIAGTLVGAVLNDILPDVVLVVLLFLVLSITAYKTLEKANALHEKESEAFALAAAAAGEEESLVKGESSYGSCATNGKASNLELGRQQSSFGPEKEHVVWKDAAKLTALFLVIIVINFVKGGPSEGGGPFGAVSCGSTCFWFSQVAMLVVIFVFVALVRASLLARMRDGGPLISDIEWNEDNTIRYPILAIVAGLVAGMFGIGGGMVTGPLMLALGAHPAVTSATSAAMILFTSSTATASYIVNGLLVPDYAIACLLLGFLSTLGGQTVISLIMKKYKRSSYIVYSIGIVILTSAVCMTIQSVFAIIND